MKLLLKPHSLDPSALAATEATIQALPMGGYFDRDESGVIRVVDGWVQCLCANPDFIRFAATRQGYVADARLEP